MINQLSKLLVKIRHQYGLSLPAAAKSIGIPKSALHKLETGENDNPTIKTLSKIAKFYKTAFTIT